MDKSLIKGLVIGATAVTAIGGLASYKVIHKQPTYAEVLTSEPVIQTVKMPRQACEHRLVTHRAPIRDQDRIAGTAIGALVGGLIGNTLGGGAGRSVATVGVAAAGGYAGNQIQKNMQNSDTRTTPETRCRTVYDNQRRIIGYKVSYRLGDKQGVVHLDYDPGRRIPVKDGQLILIKSGPPNNS